MRLPTKEKGKNVPDVEVSVALLRKAVERGVNYFDTAVFYNERLSEQTLGQAMRGLRDKIYLSTKCPGWESQKPGDYRRTLEAQLKRLETSYIDFYHFHGISYDNFFETDQRTGWIDDARKAKEEGLIKHISFSYHGKSGDIQKLVDLGLFETMLCQYNVLDRSNEEGMKYAKSKGLGVAVMGPLGGGRISGLPKKTAEKLGIKAVASAELGLRFVASNPNVDVLLSGMSSETQLEENVEYVSRLASLSASELDAIDTMMKENKRLAELYCTGCKYCVPCPHGVEIPHIFKMVNYHRIYGIKEYAKKWYDGIGTGDLKGKKADACTECGECEEKCPQKIEIRKQLKEAVELFK
ncbi:MAG: aldo/keto reductase [Phycisphaerales bacterium]|nr:aldo/keto reductase [Phycisphaerales bacterium]